MKPRPFDSLISDIESAGGSVRRYSNGAAACIENGCVVALGPWSIIDVSLLEIIVQSRQRLEGRTYIIYVLDINQLGSDIEQIFSPLFESHRAMNPIVGYWRHCRLERIEYGFGGTRSLLEWLGYPLETWKQLIRID